uniref:Neur_chan_LBD domain-containing protein n=1 Tax=Haemonchus contortus TaxID=6289 RepID=A0A7I4YQG0_HAECO
MLLYLIYVTSVLLVIADTRQAFPPVTILADINIDYITNFDFTRQTFDMIVDVDRQLKDNRFALNFNNYAVKEVFHEIRFDDVESQIIGDTEYIFKGPNVTGIRTRERLTVPCHFTQNFPFDRHTCRIKLISRKLPSDLLLLTWRSPPHMSTASTSTPYFLIDEIKPNTCDYKKSMPAATSLSSTFVTHACLAVRFVFTRSLCLVFYRFYMPSSMALFLSWLSFYVSRTDLVSRLLLVSFSLSFQLVICTLFLYSVAFPVAVATPADVWCALLVIQSILVVLFIFTSIVMESQVRKYRDLITDSKSIREDSRSRHERRAMRTAMYRKENNCTEKSACSYATVVEATYRRKGDQISLCSVRLDLVARLVCPIVYIILTSLYFLLYILSP